MKLNLTKPLIIFDLETTGLDVARDKIIQISYIKVTPDGEEVRKNYYVNPCMAIPKEVTELTHITNEMVADAPTFKQLAPTLAADFEGAILRDITQTISTSLCWQTNFCVRG